MAVAEAELCAAFFAARKGGAKATATEPERVSKIKIIKKRDFSAAGDLARGAITNSGGRADDLVSPYIDALALFGMLHRCRDLDQNNGPAQAEPLLWFTHSCFRSLALSQRSTESIALGSGLNNVRAIG